MELTAEREVLLLSLNDYSTSKENLNWKLSEKWVVAETMTASVKLLEKRKR